MLNHNTIEELLRKQMTPCYVFEEAVLRQRIDFLKTMLPTQVKLCYAVKANPFIADWAGAQAERVEVCSPGEVNICLKAGIAPEKLVVSGVYKTPEYMDWLVRTHPDIGRYTVESMEQLALLFKAGRNTGKRLPVLLRLTSGNQFGMDEAELRSVIRDRELYKEIEICGIQYFSGTQKHTARRVNKELAFLNKLCIELKEQERFTVREVEYGGGFYVPYFQEEAFDEDAYLRDIAEEMQKLCDITDVALELGRSIAASCGTYITRVVDVKTNKGQKYAIVDGGIHQLVYFGQMMAMKKPFLQKWQEEKTQKKEEWTICGSLCTANDILVKQYPLSEAKIGDVLLFERAGAYSMSEGMALFLSRELPAVFALKAEGELKKLRPKIAVDELIFM